MAYFPSTDFRQTLLHLQAPSRPRAGLDTRSDASIFQHTTRQIDEYPGMCLTVLNSPSMQ